MRTKLLMLSVMPLTLLLIEACNQSAAPRSQQPGNQAQGAGLGDYYSGWVSTYLNANCVSCHKPGGTATPDLSTYQAASAQASAILTSMQNGSMPQGTKATADQISQMQTWVQGGALENAPGSTSTVFGTGTGTGTGTGYGTGTASVSYESWVQGYVSQNCATCHKPGGTATPDLSTYQAVVANAAQSLSDMQSGRMPQGNPPTTSQVAQFQAWVSANEPESSTGVVNSGGGVGTSTSVTYDSWVQGYLSANCTSCHRPGGEATPDLTTYQGAAQYAQSSLTDMQSARMPQNGPAPTSQQIAQMQAWISANMPQDASTANTGGYGTNTGGYGTNTGIYGTNTGNVNGNGFNTGFGNNGFDGNNNFGNNGFNNNGFGNNGFNNNGFNNNGFNSGFGNGGFNP